MSTITRTLRNLWKIGIKDYGHQMHSNAGDTKAGTLVAIDRYGNKYFENNEELPLRTRWVDYKDHDLDASHIDPGWHAWISYMVDKPPTQDAIMQAGVRKWETPEHRPNMTLTRAAYKPYSTVKPKYSAWEPVTAPR
ncbi:NADH-ubiquinone oxidoreductase subunit [Trichophyton tonsurans CBS 112818]|uniref:NADH dehydrogenase [ubiquinone] 1 alpha subcomplex subunit n=1 Tax=Trichophyton tonsurans (strain CBS 112818) TaxID=647933 RepID=F2RMN7_TRIT1|nr:NADH-ubiquinone oxidoreductase subunit [Trichophyton tonsurans CBS 112818]